MIDTTSLIDLPISRDGLTADDFATPTLKECEQEQTIDTELRLLREWIEQKQCPSADDLAPLSGHMKSFAQLLDQILLRESVLIVKRSNDPEQELILVSSSLSERVIRFFHEGPGGAYQAPKATTVKIIRFFWWPELKRNVHYHVACCPVFEMFIRLSQTPCAEIRAIKVKSRGDCLAMDTVGNKDSFPITPRKYKYIITMIDCISRFAIAVPFADQSLFLLFPLSLVIILHYMVPRVAFLLTKV